MRPILNLILLLTLAIMTECDKKSTANTSKDEEQIKENFKNWVNAAEHGDVDDYFNFITDDFVFLGPGAKHIDNKDSLKSFLNRFFTNNTFSLPEWKTYEIIVREDLAIHRYSGIAYLRPKADTTRLELDRKYLDVLRKNETGEWRVHLHSFSTNK